MNPRLRALVSPLNFAGYLAWGAIGFEMLLAHQPADNGVSLPLAAVAALKPQTVAAVTVQRGAQPLQLDLTVAQRPRAQRRAGE